MAKITEDKPGARAVERFLGLDVGAETLKVVELVRHAGRLEWTRRQLVEHGKKVAPAVIEVLRDWNWASVNGAAVTGRLSEQVGLPAVPAKQAQARGYRMLFGEKPATLISIGSHGCSVLELRENGLEVFRENSRCSQGTGNFLRQLVERFSVTLEEAGQLAAAVDRAAVLSGRCPVILKTDMTHLANTGEDRARILAGLFDAVCENVLTLVKPGVSPKEVLLLGGVTRSPRIQTTFRTLLARHGMSVAQLEGDDGLFFEALGSAIVAVEQAAPVPTMKELLKEPKRSRLDRVPGLSHSLAKVKRLAKVPFPAVNGEVKELVLGFDIGSTGSKVVAIEGSSRQALWEAYRSTNGDPVGAAQGLLNQFVESPLARHYSVQALGVTGSGREVVGSLMTTCFGKEVVCILNEIVAHAEGARFFDERVDTIFEIGGQDAKYIRLASGRVVDSAMNEACSAGTGSFIAEQGSKFAGMQHVSQLSEAALRAGEGVSLGQHCSVFMAEIIDEAVAAGVGQESIIAGLYDSIIQNYLHRVKGSRSVGQVIFCQGMPFASDALAAAVARQTGSEVIVPPNPGTVGALGIALLTAREIAWQGRGPLELQRFLRARVESKDHFQCKATTGCGGNGNKCRIERLRTVVEGEKRMFSWGGGCALYDKAARKKKLPNRAPDPFREREEMSRQILAPFLAPKAGRSVALTDEFVLKGLAPFFVVFLHELGFVPQLVTGGDHGDLKRGIRSANVPYCAPMQLYHGVAQRLKEIGADYVLLPMVRSMPRVNGEPLAKTCPIVQASPDLMRWDLKMEAGPRVISPVFDSGLENLESADFLKSCEQLARELGIRGDTWLQAHQAARRIQEEFDSRCQELGERALAFCREHQLMAVVVLGRPYTIYNTVLNSNVPAILREQGAVGIPVDCYPTRGDAPMFKDMYWGYGQRLLRAAHQVRRSPGVYAIYCSNYSCGPDSFNLHFFSYIMEGKPFAIIETDGHSGDAGTKTRVEVFLHCAEQDRQFASASKKLTDFKDILPKTLALSQMKREKARMLVPWMGPGADVIAAGFRGFGIRAEIVPPPDGTGMHLGRQQTSGKECLPISMTIGALLKHLQELKDVKERLVYLFPSGTGPCRFGVYNLLNQIVFERLGLKERVQVWTPEDTGYFAELPAGFAILMFTAFMAGDLLQDGLLDATPGELIPGASRDIHQRYMKQLLELLERSAGGDMSAKAGLFEVISGPHFGVRRLLSQAAAEFVEVRNPAPLPTVLVAGEIYVRSVPAANNHVVEKLQQRGFRIKLSPANEWLRYTEYLSGQRGEKKSLSGWINGQVQRRVRELTEKAMGKPLGWHPTVSIPDCLAEARPYLREELTGEAVLTLGMALTEWRRGYIDAVVSVGPLECMPNKIAEAQFFHMAERERLPTLTLSLNGDPVNPRILDNFAFEVNSRFKKNRRPEVDGKGEGHKSQLLQKQPDPDLKGAPIATPGEGSTKRELVGER